MENGQEVKIFLPVVIVAGFLEKPVYSDKASLFYNNQICCLVFSSMSGTSTIASTILCLATDFT